MSAPRWQLAALLLSAAAASAQVAAAPGAGGPAGAAAAAAEGSTEPGIATGPEPVLPSHTRDELGRSLEGGVGLSHVRSGFVGEGQLLVSVHAGFFRAGAFTQTAGVDEYRATVVGAAYAPLRFLEFSAVLRSAALEQPAAASQHTFLMNDLLLRARGATTVLEGAMALSAEVALRLPPPVFRSTKGLSPYFGALFGYDLRRHGAPLLFHLNAGFFLDNSVEFDDGTGDQTRRFALKINTFNQWHTAAGLEGRFDARGVGIRPFLEYELDVSLGATGPLPMRVIPGVRVLPWRGLYLDGTVEIGASRPTAAGVLPVPLWQLVFGVGYQTGFEGAVAAAPAPAVVERVVEKTVAAPPVAATTGRIHGLILEAEKGRPLADATVELADGSRLLTAKDGTFTAKDQPPGDAVVKVSHEGFAPNQGKTKVDAGGVVELKLSLAALPPEPPKPMTVKGTVLNEAEKPLVATIAVATAWLSKKSGANGEFVLELPSGEQVIEVTTAGYLTTAKKVEGKPGDTVLVDFVLKEVPKLTLVVVKKEKIEIKKQVHFASNRDVILPDSNPLLEQVAAVLLEAPRLRLIRIEGHTDDVGDDAYNLELSQRRANSVMRALIERGIGPERLRAVGFGETTPLAPNKNAAARAANRRVEFMIQEQD